MFHFTFWALWVSWNYIILGDIDPLISDFLSNDQNSTEFASVPHVYSKLCLSVNYI